jgi:putative ATPase
MDDALDLLVTSSNGDARRLLGFLERLQGQAGEIDVDRARKLVGMQVSHYDRQGDLHYDIASAFIKSMRASDPDAALYWMARMLNGGEDPRFVARRIMIFASEDVGNADPLGLLVATSVMEAVKAVGMPEAAICLSQAVTYLSLAEKSNASYRAWSKASEYARKTPDLDVPVHYKDANYAGAARLERGTGYEYPHDMEDAVVTQRGLEDDILFYEPLERGREARLRERLERVREIRTKANRNEATDSKRGKI